MLSFPVPGRSSKAYSFAPFSSAVRSRIFAAILIVVLIVPGLMLPGKASAGAVRVEGPTAPTIAHASPEAFSTHSESSITKPASSLAELRTLIDEVLFPTLPEGFEAAKIPSLPERVLSAISSKREFSATKRHASTASAPVPPPATVPFDFDGDGKADIGRWQGSSTEFTVRNSNGGSYTTNTMGSGASVPAPGDFDGDDKTDATVFHAGSWVIERSSNGATQSVSFGTTGDKPVAADYDGDGTTDIAIFRPSTNAWWILKSSDSSAVSTSFGSSGDIPVTGNWDGDSYADLAVYRPSTGYWYVHRSTAGSLSTPWGTSGDIPVAADFDGDGKTDLTVYRPSTGAWWIMKSSTGFNGAHVSHTWGNYGDQPVPADYDGDGTDDLAVWRPKTGVWYIAKSSEDFEEFDYHSLGIAGNTAVPSAYIAQVGVTVYGHEMANARLDPKNSTGGENLYSRNFGWGTGLVSLPGRAELNAGFGISYNSLVWTKLGSEMHFDVDQSNVTPGFRFGFPTIEPVYYSDTTGKHSFLMVTPSGARVEFRNTAVTNTYETADSSYTQLKINEGQTYDTPIEEIDLTLTTTDGTMMTYEWLGGAYRCSQIKDRNGNYITIAHDEEGTLRTVTDTLGRVITVNYDNQLYPTSITQTWKTNNGQGSNTIHTWASFTYTTKTVATNFGSLTVVGPPNDTVMKVLQKVTHADGSYTKFTHNGYIQVEKVENFAADNHLLSHVRTNLGSVSSTQTDCPRFTETRNYIENFNGGNETLVNNSVTYGVQATDMYGATVNASMLQVSLQNHPTGNITNTYVHDSEWMEGLAFRVDDFANGNGLELKRSAFTTWTQDDPDLSYLLNPRTLESRVSDGVSTKRSTTEYYTVAPLSPVTLYGLVKKVEVYDANLTNVIKRVQSEYNLQTAYISRRIIGLTSKTETWGHNDATQALEYTSHVTYLYDQENFSQEPNQLISPVRHDSTNYGSSLIIGRGNLTSTTRHDVSGQSASVTSRFRYDLAGSVVAQLDPLSRKTAFSYSDSYNDNSDRSTFAYPTGVTDSGGNTSTVRYRFDIGANVRTESPAPAGSSSGKITERWFDSNGRLERDLVVNSGAYSRYEYLPNGIQSKVFSTMTDTNASGSGDTADEVLTERWSDGVGRILRSRTQHPGSLGGWTASATEFDILGRIKRSSVPTEVHVSDPANPGSWMPYGDDDRGLDSNSGPVWLWRHQRYDWLDRVVRTINTDGDPVVASNDSDVFISYEGCGCAGGLVTTVQSEMVPRSDQPTQNARRVSRTYQDILGRTVKSEALNWNGTVYSTTTKLFNGRDQAITTRAFRGVAELTNEHQTTTATFDGHGRLKTSHAPEQDSAGVTSYSYFADDQADSITDARGAVGHHTYNSQGLLNQLSYSLPQGSTIPAVGAVAFTYDSVGNRSQMTDQTGTTTYSYDPLSRLTSETKQFNGQNNSPVQPYTLSYTYHLGGELKSITEPFGQRIDYTTDRVGRLTHVSGTYFNNPVEWPQPPYILSNVQYFAFGGVKSLSYGSGATMNQSFNDRRQVSEYKVKAVAWWAQSEPWSNMHTINMEYSYLSDGRIRYSREKTATNVDSVGDRGYRYDHVGRLAAATTGAEARGGTETNPDYRPYRQDLSYDPWGNVTRRDAWHYGHHEDVQYIYSNNRATGWSYDPDGRLTQSTRIFNNFTERIDNVYDAAGAVSTSANDTAPLCEDPGTTSTTWIWSDGNGQPAAKRVSAVYRSDPNVVVESDQRFYLRSSVLDRVVSEVRADGARFLTYTYAFGQILTRGEYGFAGGWEHRDPSNARYSSTRNDLYGGTESGGTMLDPVGSNVGGPQEMECSSGLYDDWWTIGFSPARRSSCTWDGGDVSCSLMTRLLNNDSSLPASLGSFENLSGFTFDAFGNGIYRAKLLGNKQTVPETIRHNFQLPDETLYFEDHSTLNNDDEFRFELWYSADADAGEGLRDRIKGVLFDPKALSDACTKAFQALGAKPIKEQLAEKNLTFVTQAVFMDPRADGYWAPDQKFVDAMRNEANSRIRRYLGFGPAITGEIEVADIAFQENSGVYNGKRFIGLTDWGMKEKFDHLSVTLVHAMIHSGGGKGQPGGVSDLHYLKDKYDAAIDACQSNKSKVKRAGGN